jgi:hypothetical protein
MIEFLLPSKSQISQTYNFGGRLTQVLEFNQTLRVNRSIYREVRNQASVIRKGRGRRRGRGGQAVPGFELQRGVASGFVQFQRLRQEHARYLRCFAFLFQNAHGTRRRTTLSVHKRLRPDLITPHHHSSTSQVTNQHQTSSHPITSHLTTAQPNQPTTHRIV